ncbi:hypothetical protein [Planctomycetes bacterium TBK1r]|uniref:Uncharacterized protein n=1 Tax=Stieleria magnilauensis TaxID=2527963 RepID=A0ABX5XUW7_9BACT|nr:hypothetical protein TBK1r_48440 [Planctomycetes bacterium TBK1r]
MTRDKHHNHRPQHRKKAIHTDWRAWAAVALMLAAMAAYVLSLDEAIGPQGGGQVVPAIDGGGAP